MSEERNDKNFVKLYGTISDIEVREFKSGTKKATFTLENHQTYKGKVDKTFAKVEAWKDAAEQYAAHKDGDFVEVEGLLFQNSYEQNALQVKTFRYGWRQWKPRNQNVSWEEDNG